MTILSWARKTRSTYLRVKKTAAQRPMMTDLIFKKQGSTTWENLLTPLDMVRLLLDLPCVLLFMARVRRYRESLWSGTCLRPGQNRSGQLTQPRLTGWIRGLSLTSSLLRSGLRLVLVSLLVAVESGFTRLQYISGGILSNGIPSTLSCG